MNEDIRDCGKKIFVIATGAGAGIQKALWDVPGISAVLVGAAFPYAKEETDNILGFEPEKYSAAETSMDLAQAAYMRAWEPGIDAVGIGLAASVSSVKARRGSNRVFVTTVSATGIWTLSAQLEAGVGVDARARDGAFCDEAGIAVLRHALFQDPVRMGVFEESSALAEARFFAHPYFAANGTRKAELVVKPYLKDVLPYSSPVLLFPGAFNPPHAGHFGMKAQAEKTSEEVVFEVTADAPHKDHLSVVDMLQRAKMLQGHARIFTKGAPLYVDKVRRYKVPVVLGADAMLRIFDPKWCEDRLALVEEFKKYAGPGCFYVFDRIVDGAVVTLPDIKRLVPELSNVGWRLPGQWDVSSSQIRGK